MAGQVSTASAPPQVGAVIGLCVSDGKRLGLFHGRPLASPVAARSAWVPTATSKDRPTLRADARRTWRQNGKLRGPLSIASASNPGAPAQPRQRVQAPGCPPFEGPPATKQHRCKAASIEQAIAARGATPPDAAIPAQQVSPRTICTLTPGIQAQPGDTGVGLMWKTLLFLSIAQAGSCFTSLFEGPAPASFNPSTLSQVMLAEHGRHGQFCHSQARYRLACGGRACRQDAIAARFTGWYAPAWANARVHDWEPSEATPLVAASAYEHVRITSPDH